jgi:hypothetical protein
MTSETSRLNFQRPGQNTGRGESNKVTNHVYANILINNNTDDLIRAEYLVNQNQPILSKQEDFQMRLIRFKVPMSAVPMFIFEPNRYFISIGIAQDNLAVPPTDQNRTINQFILPPEEAVFYPQLYNNNSVRDTEPAYRNGVYHINDFLRGVNEALRTLWAQIAGVAPYNGITGAGVGISADNPPRIGFSTAQNRFYFQLPVRTDLEDPPGTLRGVSPLFYHALNEYFPGLGSLRIYMSASLYALFNGFPAFEYGPRGVIDINAGVPIPQLTHALNLDFDRCSVKTNVVPILGTPADPNDLPWPVQICYQEQTSVYAWQHASRILVTSSMGFVKECVVANRRGSTGTPDQLEVLTDFSVVQDPSSSNREYIYFADNGSTRYIDTKATGVLNTIDVRVLVEFDNGARVPLFIKPHEEVNLKLAFDRKPHNDTVQISDATHHTFEN